MRLSAAGLALGAMVAATFSQPLKTYANPPEVAANPAAPPAATASDAEAKSPAATGDAAQEEARRAAARMRIASIPEIGACHREALGSGRAEDEGGDKTGAKNPMAEERALFQDVATRFADVAREYHAEIDATLDQTYKTRVDEVGRRYRLENDNIELTERERRNEAIAQFERFISKYPNERQYTPDAMFRLAELYYERSALDYQEAAERYKSEQANAGKSANTQPPTRSFAEIVGLYQRLLATFGDEYRYADAVRYLLGYVLQESEDDLGARAAWIDLVKHHPDSKYAPEVYLRIGESYFDYGEFSQATDAYKAAMADKTSRFYDKALYKLAWTYFQEFNYDLAIRTFKDLIALYDSHGADSNTSSALKDEAIEYLAKSLAEDDWDNDGLPDKNHGIERALSYLRGGTTWEKAIIARYAEALYDLHDTTKYGESIQVFRRLIAMDPTALVAVDYQQKIIQIYDLLRDVPGSTRERQQLAEMFSPESAWAKKNASDFKHIAEASQAVELELRRRALTLHQHAQELKTQAQEDKTPSLLAEASAGYRDAAKAYGDYLARYPGEPASYEMRFYRAEALYYSEQYREAASAYMDTASDPYQARFRSLAAWSAIKSYERVLADEQARGKLPAKANPAAAWEPPPIADTDTPGPRSIPAEPYPNEVRDWLGAIDFFLLRDIMRDGSRKPQVAFAYQSGTIAARFNNLEDARRRFRQVIACFPEDDLAADAMANILNTYREENDLASLERWANIADQVELGDPEVTAQIKKQIKVFKLGALFQQAEALLASGKHLEAAKEFERLADENQDATFVDKAYYNAAMAYKEVRYYESAARIFDRLVHEPRFDKSEFKTESIFELAENYKLFFAFDKAIAAYFLFLDRTQNTTNGNRPYALFTAARLQEYAGDLKVAAATYLRYADTFKDRQDAANALFRAAELYGKLSDREAQRRTLTTFIARFSKDQGMGAQVLDALMQLGDLAAGQKKTRDARKYYEDVVREYGARGFQTGTPAAAMAAKARFMLIEDRFAEYAKIRLSGTSQHKMGADIARKKKLLNELEVAYSEVLPYKALDWVIAASFRAGDIYRDFAQTLYSAPEPVGLSDEELDAYLTIIEDEGLKYENIAIERFERTVNESRRLKVTTEWAERALEAINKYKPEVYPLFKEVKRALTFTPRFRIDFDRPAPLPKVTPPAPAQPPAPAGAPNPASPSSPSEGSR